MKNYNFNILQVPINIFNHNYKQKFIKLIKLKKIELHVRSIFARIIFLNKILIKKIKFYVKINKFLLDFKNDEEKIYQCLHLLNNSSL